MTAVTKTPVHVSISTPLRLKALLACLLVATGTFWLVAEAEIARTRQSLQTIGRDSVPSIVAAEEIRVLLARANLRAIQATSGSPQEEEENWHRHDQDLAAAADKLVTAAQNITYGDDERVPILKIAERMNAYSRLVGVARAGDGTAARSLLRDATRLLRVEVLAEAEKLDHANFAHLDAEYERERHSSQAGLGAMGVFLVLALVVTQVWLARRFRRVLNLPLAIATVVVTGMWAQELASLDQVHQLVRVAKADAFDSVHALSRARAVAHDAASDEALYLADRLPADEQLFVERSAKLAQGSLGDQLLIEAANGNHTALTGYIADELANVTFAGEREQALLMARSYRDYRDAHKDATYLAWQGRSPRNDRVGPAFEQFDSALVATLAVNQRAFDRTVAEAFTVLDGLTGPLGMVTVVLAGLSWFGVRSRLREYAD